MSARARWSRHIVWWTAILSATQPLVASAQAEVFTKITDKFIELLTGRLARGLGIIAMAACLLLYLFGEGGRFFKTVLGVVFAVAALINLSALYDSIVG